MESSHAHRFDAYRFLVVGSCVILALASLVRLSIRLNPSITKSGASSSVSNFQVRVCDDAWQRDLHYEDDEIDHVSVTLHEGCFSGYLYLPKSWNAWWVQPSGDQNGDWIAIWMPGGSPAGPYSPNQGNQFQGNPLQFRLQGHGTYIFYSNVKLAHSNSDGSDDPSGATAGHGYIQKSEIKPMSGADDDYTFIIEQCHRSGEKILCSGKATNKTDASTRLSLRDSGGVDDEGNSFGIMIFGGSFSFPGAQEIGGANQKLLPNVPTRFEIIIGDPHLNVKKVNLDLSTDWDNGNKHDHLIYEGVPVQ